MPLSLYERDLHFERQVVGDETDRARLTELWPLASIPVLVDDVAGATLPESTMIVEYLDGVGDAPQLIPADPAAALQARLWDRVLDGHVMTPMQKIVGDALRREGRGDPEGIGEARATLDRTYDLPSGSCVPARPRTPSCSTTAWSSFGSWSGVGSSPAPFSPVSSAR
jgi:glutathione S-transferase